MNKLFERQGIHLLTWVLLGAALYFAAMQFPIRHHRGAWGISALEWMSVSWVFAGLSQAWVAVVWRLELYRGTISATLGKAGFVVHEIVYVVLFAGRFLPLIPLSRSTAQTLAIPMWVSIPFWVLTLPLTLWAIYSAVFYFGLARAAGVDHFDPAYRGRTFEKRGIYKYVDNGMYTVALLALYHPGLWLESSLGLITGAAHHAFAWTHYYCTEKPDLREIYGGSEQTPASESAICS